MDFTKINKVGRLEEYLPTKKMAELEVFQNYRLTGIRKVKTKFGARVTVDVDNNFTVFLPARMAKVLTDDDELFTQMIQACEENKIQMRYLGGQYNQVEFIYM